MALQIKNQLNLVETSTLLITIFSVKNILNKIKKMIRCTLINIYYFLHG